MTSPLSPDDTPGGSGLGDSVRDLGSSLGRALLLPVGFVVAIWAVEIFDTILPGNWELWGIVPRSLEGLRGVAAAPLLHDDWAHLIGNSIPLLVLGFLLATAGPRTFVLVTALIWVAGGLGVWLFAGPQGIHLGASGIVFGWIAYLVTRGVFSRSGQQIAIGIGVLALYGTTLLGVLPGQEGVSWQGHLFGAIAGVVAAWLLNRREHRATAT